VSTTFEQNLIKIKCISIHVFPYLPLFSLIFPFAASWASYMFPLYFVTFSCFYWFHQLFHRNRAKLWFLKIGVYKQKMCMKTVKWESQETNIRTVAAGSCLFKRNSRNSSAKRTAGPASNHTAQSTYIHTPLEGDRDPRETGSQGWAAANGPYDIALNQLIPTISQSLKFSSII